MSPQRFGPSRGSAPAVMRRGTDGAPAPAAEIDAEQVAALAGYLGVIPESVERLQSLRDQLQGILCDKFAVVAADLIQLRGLLAEASGKLSGTFQVVTARSTDLRETIARMPDGNDATGLLRIGELAGEITSATGTTVQTLQFEDMATQLLQHLDGKLSILSRLSWDMAVVNPTSAGVPPMLRAEQLDALFAKFEGYRAELDATARKVVQQKSLASGDIELF